MVNKVILIGNTGKDPDVRYTTDGKAVANVTLATSEVWKDKQSGETQERTEWHTVVFFGRLAEIVGEYVRKGRQVYVEGSLRTRKWQDKNGVERYTTEIIASELQLLGSRAEGQAAIASAPRKPTVSSNPRTAAAPATGANVDDDIPFAPYLKGSEYLA